VIREKVIRGVSGSIRQGQNKTSSKLEMELPARIKATLGSAIPQRMRGLIRNLKGKRGGSISDHLGGLFGDGVDANKKADGTKILGHVFENKQ
jgi:hypothetical protein